MAFLLRVIVDEADTADPAPYRRARADAGVAPARVTGYLFGAPLPARGHDPGGPAIRDPDEPPALSEPG